MKLMRCRDVYYTEVKGAYRDEYGELKNKTTKYYTSFGQWFLGKPKFLRAISSCVIYPILGSLIYCYAVAYSIYNAFFKIRDESDEHSLYIDIFGDDV